MKILGKFVRNFLGFNNYPNGSVLFEKRSYGKITVEEKKDKTVRVIKRDGKTLSGINLESLQPTSPLLWYPHLSELFPRSPKRVLCLGGGACAYPIYAIKKNPHIFIDVIEVDPVVIGAAKRFFPLPSNNRFNLIKADALVWLDKGLKNKYDLIFVDVGIIYTETLDNKNTQFLDKSALKKYRDALNSKGSIMINIITTLSKKDAEKTAKSLEVYKKTFQASLTFKTNSEAKKSELNDILYLYCNQKLNISFLRKRLHSISPNKLSYPKKVYKIMLDSHIE